MMDTYLDEVKAKRYLELLHDGDIHGYAETDDRKEFDALSKESIARQIEIYGEPKPTPFDGRCRRCGKEFDSPVPEVTYPGGIVEIASHEWCAECNAFAMNIVYRWSSAYRVDPKNLVDPVRGGEHAGS